MEYIKNGSSVNMTDLKKLTEEELKTLFYAVSYEWVERGRSVLELI